MGAALPPLRVPPALAPGLPGACGRAVAPRWPPFWPGRGVCSFLRVLWAPGLALVLERWPGFGADGAAVAGVAPATAAGVAAGFAAAGAPDLGVELFFADGLESLPPSFGKAAFSLRTTGASTVDDADLTNSPMSLSFSRTVLLSTPSSLANSYTRAFATQYLLKFCVCQPRIGAAIVFSRRADGFSSCNHVVSTSFTPSHGAMTVFRPKASIPAALDVQRRENAVGETPIRRSPRHCRTVSHRPPSPPVHAVLRHGRNWIRCRSSSR